MLYAVMEFADEDLSHVVPVRSLTAAEAEAMLRPALEALAFLHARGLVHGHLKPSNIMAVGDQLKLSSDGICAARNPALGRSRPTPYDAPEAGTRGGSAAGDVWSLGVTLVEVLTQKLPAWEFKGQEEAQLPRMPAPFGDIVRLCLRRDPQQRCSLAEVASRLNPDAAPLGQQAAPVRAAEPPPPKPAPRAPSVTLAAKPQPSLRRQKSARTVVWRAAGIVAVIVVAALAVLKISSRGSAVDVERDAKVVAADAQPVAGEPNASSENVAPLKSGSPKMATGAPPAPPPEPAAHPETEKMAVAAVGGGVTHQVLPVVPESARSTIQGTVRVGVRVEVDATGKVMGADLDSAGPSKYFAALAEKAARGWEFLPPSAGGAPVSSHWIVRFEFQPDGTKATAIRTAQQ
jgi:TonB family protein